METLLFVGHGILSGVVIFLTLLVGFVLIKGILELTANGISRLVKVFKNETNNGSGHGNDREEG